MVRVIRMYCQTRKYFSITRATTILLDRRRQTSCHPPLITSIGKRIHWQSHRLLVSRSTFNFLLHHGFSAVIRRSHCPTTGQFVFQLERIIAKYVRLHLIWISIPFLICPPILISKMFVFSPSISVFLSADLSGFLASSARWYKVSLWLLAHGND